TLPRIRAICLYRLSVLPRTLVTEIAGAEQAAARAQICVAGGAPRNCESVRTRDCDGVVRESFTRCPAGNRGLHLARESFVRCGALVREHAHRQDDEDCRDD